MNKYGYDKRLPETKKLSQMGKLLVKLYVGILALLVLVIIYSFVIDIK